MYRDYSYWRPRPSNSDFKLNVVSRHPDFNGRSLKKYSLDGIDTIGAYGNEPFEVHFTNNSLEDVQVRISLDGTDCLTGKPANLEINHEMWLVRAGKTLHLKAWAENSQGGARFVFTNGENSVALHAHGDVSHKGIISAAVYTDANRPVHVARERQDHSWHSGGGHYYAKGAGMTLGGSAPVAAAAPATTCAVPISESTTMSFNADMSRSTMDSMDLSEGAAQSESFKKSAAVGAGEYVEQRTKTVKGLDKPELHSIVRMRYMWFDDLVEGLRKQGNNYGDKFPTGFPGEKIRSFADLSGVPRVKSVGGDGKPNRFEEAQRTYSSATETNTSFERFV